MKKLREIIKNRILGISQEFEYANLTEFIIWKILKENKFVQKTSLKIFHDKALDLMEKYSKQELVL